VPEKLVSPQLVQWAVGLPLTSEGAQLQGGRTSKSVRRTRWLEWYRGEPDPAELGGCFDSRLHGPNFRPLDQRLFPRNHPQARRLVTSTRRLAQSKQCAAPQSQSQATADGHGRDGHGHGHGHSPRSDRTNMGVAASDPLTAVKSNHLGDQEGSGLRSVRREHRSELVTESDAEKNSGPLRVLIVENNAINRMILTTMLKRVVCHYPEAVDGADAVIIFDAFQPDLVLLDINMPIKDGFQAAVEMRQIEHKQGRKRARVIAVTALSGEAHRRKGIKASIDSWLVKPVGIKQLKDEVEKMIVKDEEDE
jgi:CheY-like chemotaxis protein